MHISGKFFFIEEIVINVSRPKTQLKAHLRFLNRKFISLITVYDWFVRQVSANKYEVSEDNHEDQENWNISVLEL